ncbi:MAG: hypothetical protein RL060_562, partial [Bacteroidota bacterium]
SLKGFKHELHALYFRRFEGNNG